MVNNVVNATYVETYDLRTVAGKMAIIGIHTPTAVSLKKMYKGFFENYKKLKVRGCDVVGVCASNQALTPSEVGITAGLTDPRDVLNPILFKACTGENLNLLLDRIYGTAGTDYGSMHRVDTDVANELDMYYTMLADDSFRKFHPQGGIRITDLKPFVHKVATTQPFKWETAGGSVVGGTVERPMIGVPGNPPDGSGGSYGFGGSNGANGGVPSVFVSTGLEPMPWLETTVEKLGTMTEGSDFFEDQLGTYLATNIPRCYCGVIILPPAVLQPLYFRFSVRWHISFKDFRPAYEISTLGASNAVDVDSGVSMSSGGLYYNLYNVASTLDAEYGSFDVNGSDSVDVVNERAL